MNQNEAVALSGLDNASNSAQSISGKDAQARPLEHAAGQRMILVIFKKKIL